MFTGLQGALLPRGMHAQGKVTSDSESALGLGEGRWRASPAPPDPSLSFGSAVRGGSNLEPPCGPS